MLGAECHCVGIFSLLPLTFTRLRPPLPQASERDYDLNRAAELKYGTLLELQRALQEAEAALQSADSRSNRMLHSEVTEDDIAEIVAKWTGIPVSSLKARCVCGGGRRTVNGQ